MVTFSEVERHNSTGEDTVPPSGAAKKAPLEQHTSNSTFFFESSNGIEQEGLAKLCKAARKKLKPFADAPPFSFSPLIELRGKFMKACFACGNLEGVGTLLRLASLDQDGSGLVTEQEINNYLAQGETAVAKITELCLQTGVVTALVLSFVVPSVQEPPAASEPAMERFGSPACHAIMTAVQIVNFVIFLTSATSIYISVRVYTALSMWLVSSTSRIRFVHDCPYIILSMSALTIVVIVLLATSLMLTAFITYEPNAAYASAAGLVCALTLTLAVENRLYSSASIEQHRDAKRLLVEKKAIINAE